MSNTALILLLLSKASLFPTKFWFCAKNDDISKIKAFLVLKAKLSETAYICVPTYQISSFQHNSNEFSGALTKALLLALLFLIPQNCKKSNFELSKFYQTLNVNNQKTTRAKYINLHTIRKDILCCTILMGDFSCIFNNLKVTFF